MEAVVIQRLLKDIDQETVRTTTEYTDNQAAIVIAQNNSNKTSTKHIDIKYHYVRDAVSNQDISLEYCPSKEMIADILKKAIPRDQHQYLSRKMGIINPSSSIHQSN